MGVQHFNSETHWIPLEFQHIVCYVENGLRMGSFKYHNIAIGPLQEEWIGLVTQKEEVYDIKIVFGNFYFKSTP
jgi:hypothetical protein